MYSCAQISPLIKTWGGGSGHETNVHVHVVTYILYLQVQPFTSSSPLLSSYEEDGSKKSVRLFYTFLLVSAELYM